MDEEIKKSEAAAETAPAEEERVVTASEKLENETILFENKTDMNTKALFRMQTTSFLKTPSNWIFYGIVFAAFVAMAVARPEGFQLEGLLFIVGFTVLVAVIIPLTMWFVSRRAEKNIARQGDLGQTVTVTDQMLYYSAGGKTVGFEFAAFTRIMQNKDYYYLVTYAKQMIMVDKNGFTEGDAEAFLPYIAEKTAVK